MDECKPVGTPAEGSLTRNKEAGPDREYMSLVGSLLYAAMVSRPDIAYAVHRRWAGTFKELRMSTSWQLSGYCAIFKGLRN